MMYNDWVVDHPVDIIPAFIAFTGDRYWRDLDRIGEIMDELKIGVDDVILHGGQGRYDRGQPVGVDLCVDIIARQRHLTVERFDADWNKHGKAAGPIRNGTMVQRLNQKRREGFRTMVVAIHPDLYGSSKGTISMVKQSKMARHTVVLFEQ